MDILVTITAQYFENYNTSDEGAPYWKAKGGQTFTLRADADSFMYAREFCVEAIQALLARESNSHCRYEYIDHDLVFSEPIELKGFERVLDGIIAEKHAIPGAWE